MNRIVNDLLEQNNGHYMHCIEVATVSELINSIWSLVPEFIDKYSNEEIEIFFIQLEVCYFSDDENEQDEKDLYSFNKMEVVEEAINYHTY